ncbi:MAG: rhodanese-like domain-containing protein [Firmicutes bacterium]|nr:rhodanese-like domain-containing protein [Bacillota bacterium]
MLQWMPVDVKEQMQKNKDLQIIDVREPSEFSSGHIPGAKNIPLGQLSSRYKEIDPSKDTAVVCLSGGRSSRACEMLEGAGYKKVYNLMGGMSRWDGAVE